MELADHVAASPGLRMAAISLIVIAGGPERLVQRARDIATSQRSRSVDVVEVVAGGMAPGAARNVGVRRSTSEYFLVIDGSEQPPPGYALSALDALNAAPDAAFAAAPGGPLFGTISSGAPGIDAAALVGSAWAVGPALVRRAAFDSVGGFDESLPALIEWDFLLALVGAGHRGVLLPMPGSRYSNDDVRLREALAVSAYLPAMRAVFEKHQATFETHMRAALVARERTAKALFLHERSLLDRRAAALSALKETTEAIASLRPALARYGQRTVDFGDLRTTTPVSRSWGSERGAPIDRHYIHQFLRECEDDVRGQVLEMLDADLTTGYGGSRVERSDVLDIDPGNTRATVIGDLRVAAQLPESAYDCFILTQTLHLIDDMPAALRSAHRVLKPGGVLLVTLPCASMVATEYGPKGDHWRVTEAGARALFEQVFTPADLSIRARGNLLTTTAFLHGLSCDDLDESEFAVDDAAYPLLITVRARKPADETRLAGTRSANAASAVLLYHRVADLARDVHDLAVSPAAFQSQMEELRANWRVVPLRELADAAAHGVPPPGAIALTFDDGYLDNFATAAPILADLGLPATFFLTTERRRPRSRFWWDVLAEAFPEDRGAHDEWYARLKVSAPVLRNEIVARLARERSVPLCSDADRPMTDAEILALRAFPLIEIGAHTVHHLSLPDLTPDECHREVFESRSALERLTGRPVTTFAYPFAAASPEAVAAVTAAGFLAAVVREDRPLRTREHRLRVPRVVTRNESGAELRARLTQLAVRAG